MTTEEALASPVSDFNGGLGSSTSSPQKCSMAALDNQTLMKSDETNMETVPSETSESDYSQKHETGKDYAVENSSEPPPSIDNINVEVVQKLSSITALVEAESNESPADAGMADVEEKPQESSLKKTFTVIDYNSITTPPEYKSFISLRGCLLPADGIEDFDLFKIASDVSVTAGTELGNWQGQWGMNDEAFTAPNGVLSPFSYSVKKMFNLLEENETSNKNRVNVSLSGSFKLKSPDPNTGNPFTDVEELDLQLKFSITDIDTIKVEGSGENKYGRFRLIGQYDPSSLALNCYREYSKAVITPKPRLSKRKGSVTAKKSTAKRPKPSVFPGNAISTTSDTSAKKRERKAAPKMKGAFTLKALKGSNLESNSDDLDEMRKILAKTIQSDRERWFSEPVDASRLGLTDYHQIIHKPMDLGTVSQKLNNDIYQDYHEVVEDIRLVFQNAMIYNPPRHAIHSVAATHLKLFEKDLKVFLKEKDKKAKEMEKKLIAKEKAREKARKEKAKARQSMPVTTNQSTPLASPTNAGVTKAKTPAFQKSTLMSMFSSSDEDSSDDDSDNSNDPLEKKPEPKKAKPKKKKKKNKMKDQMKFMFDMMSQMNQMTQMNDMQKQELVRLRNEVAAMKQPIVTTELPYTPTMNMMGQPGMHQMYNQFTPQQMGMHMGQPVIQPASQTTGNPKQPPKQKKFTLQQRKKIGTNINKLTQDDLSALISLLSSLGQDLGEGEELELDLEKMDATVLVEVEKFVNKKLLKAKKAAHIQDLQFDDGGV